MVLRWVRVITSSPSSKVREDLPPPCLSGRLPRSCGAPFVIGQFGEYEGASTAQSPHPAVRKLSAVLVYQLDLPYLGRVCVSTVGSSELDSVLYVRDVCNVDDDIICNDDYEVGRSHSEVEFDVVDGVNYLVVVDLPGVRAETS